MKMQENSGKKHRCSTGQSCGEWQPLISVIVPVYNAEPYLAQCIESVTRQTYRNLEIILVDDGSTDESPALCDAYARTDARIKVIHKKNEGLVRARKTGVLQAGGEYITYVDADDWIDLNAYETIVEKTAGWQADMILYGLVEEYEDSRVEKQNAFAEGYYGKKALKETICPQMLCNEVFFRFGILPNLVCKLVRRELLRKVQPMVSDEIEMGEDADCTFQMLAQAGSAQIIRYAPYHYRKRQDSMVRRATDLSRVSSLYTDLRKSFDNSEERDALMPQLYRYMLFILLLKATERFVEFEAFEKNFQHKKIVLYGAGGFGQEMYRVLTEKCLGEVVLWADKRYPVYQESGLPVAAPEEIAACAYDVVFITVLDTQVCEGIAKTLAKQGVSREKMSYIEPVEPYLEIVTSILETERTD